MKFEETGTLPIGVFYDGKLCTEFTIRPLKTKQSLAFQRSEDYARCMTPGDGEHGPQSDDELMGLGLLGRRLEIDGVPPEAQDLAFMEEFNEDDLVEVLAADGRLKEQIAGFRGASAEAAGAGAAEAGLPAGGGEPAGGEPGRGGGMAECMDCHSGPEAGYGLEDNPDSPYP